MMTEHLSFDDVLLIPTFSNVESRKDVSLETNFCGIKLQIPVISSNMDTVTDARMAASMALNGAIGALHRFNSIEDNVYEFCNAIDLTVNCKGYTGQNPKPMVSVGIGDSEYERALALVDAGATHVIIDVAHGAAIHVVKQYDSLRAKLGQNVAIIVGNFTNKEGIGAFNFHSSSKEAPDAYKIGIGGGSLCTTRIVTGCGLPTYSSIVDCVSGGYDVIADGGIRNSGDLAKALAAGAKVAMCGQMFAGTDEAPGDLYTTEPGLPNNIENIKHKIPLDLLMKNGRIFKKYRGSASLDSYKVQGKVASHRAPEGETTLIPYKGSVSGVLETLSAGLRSSLTYVGATNLMEFRENATFARVTASGAMESKAHAKKD